MSTDLFGNPEPDSRPAGGSLSDSGLAQAPLAVRMRPKTLAELAGQQHLLESGSPLRRLVAGQVMSVFLWGPPGVGKTTLAAIVSEASGARFVELSAVGVGVRELRAELNTARQQLAAGKRTVLFIDEVHRFSKTQQDVLLPAVENRLVTLIAATTENPSFSVISPLLSRSLLLRLQPLTDEDLAIVLERALSSEHGLGGAFELPAETRADLQRLAQGDARRALTYLEEAAAVAASRQEHIITRQALESAADRAVVSYDRDGDQHYDVISAFIKSIRGSDVDAALHYLARMLEAGEDPRFIARRLMILASEDIGMAAPGVLNICVAAAQAVALLGMPEARITLSHATVAAASAPKSNAAYLALEQAIADVRAGKAGPVPSHLRDGHYPGASQYGHQVGYRYPHDDAAGVVAQQYLPDELVAARYYRPTNRGAEAQVAKQLAVVNQVLGKEPMSDRVTANPREE